MAPELRRNAFPAVLRRLDAPRESECDAASLLAVSVVAWSAAAVLVALAVLAGAATRVAVLERPVRVAVPVVEGLLLVLVVADLGLVLRADAEDRPDSMLTHLGYGVAAVGLLPLLVSRRPDPDDPEAPVEPASLWVLAIALVAVAVCVVRLVQTR